ncbi:hypothetical protein D1B31_08000 [Neobacillus notoginsengisoli]|uniref:Uncharacterized protein n=1 Tax=Neobacillus notoginsengisoli TaxID=1578198 RepID=A0A417YW68_9BACI|nr:hypothetical protein [Neobacillus notoginsengisoli]RHW41650.1 hypothetical protein D1B31_08000 [Neobacillus notoginsengisoli]
MVKWLAYLVIGFAYFMGILAVDEWLADRSGDYLAAYLVMGLGIFLVGLFLLKGKVLFSFKLFKNYYLRAYLVITIGEPLSYEVFDQWRLGKFRKLADLKDVWMFPGSIGWLNLFIYSMGAAFILTAAYIFIVGLKESGKNVILLCVFSLLLTAFSVYITKNDFEAIRTDGIVTHKLGKKEEIAWSEVRHVDILGYLSEDGVSKNRTRSFKWDFVFYLNDGTEKRIGPFLYSEFYLNGSLDIKKLIIEKKIPMATDKITKEEWGFIKVHMEYEDGNPEDFYSVFQYNPEAKEYYSIPYE